MFADLMSEQFNKYRHSVKKEAVSNDTKMAEESKVENEIKEADLLKYRKKLAESNAKFKQEMQTKVTYTLFAADKEWKESLQTNYGQEVNEKNEKSVESEERTWQLSHKRKGLKDIDQGLEPADTLD